MKTSTLEEIQAALSTEPFRVLVLEDSQSDGELMLLQLKEMGMAIEATLVANQQQFRRALGEGDFAIVLSDYHLGNWTGMDALKEMRASGKDIPFLLVTGTLGEEAAVECIKQGVDDYVLKGNRTRLPLAIKRAMSQKNLRDENNRAKEALQLSEARNRDLINNSFYGIFRATPTGRFLDANPALLGILACNKAEELKLLNLGDDVYRFAEQYLQHVAECRARGLVHGAETEWKRRDGGIVAVRVNLRHVQSPEEGETIEFIAEDVTELRAMERQLQQAQKFEAIGQLAGGIAHDFNNVVGAILGWAELGIEENRGRTKVSERFTRIKEQTERAAALTRELLAFARRQVLQPRAVDINTVTSGLTSFLEKVIGRDVELKVATNPIEAVRADPTQLEQVLMNLCLNARDAMPSGGRLVVETEMVELDDSFCRFYPEVKPGRYVVLSVSDTGIGMDTQTRERIFEPFFTTKERGKGSGMGLATVYGIVKQHGGFIHVYSEPGQGSLFRVYLPVTEGTPAESAPARAAVSLAEMKGTETILLADDHESIREMSRQALMSLGYRVLSACDGVEALRLCENEAPALAILDVVMPKMGGPAVAEKLIEQYGRIPIVFASGYAQDFEGIAKASYAQYLQKPYSPTTLGCMVREILNEAKRQDTAM